MAAANERRVLGKPLPNIDGLDKVTGKSCFGADVKLPGMLYGKILRSSHAHARIKRIDISKAMALPGVAAVVTGTDAPALAPGTVVQLGDIPLNMYDLSRVVIARDKALFVGHPVAAVAATSREMAEEALSLIEVEYEVLPPVLDAMKAMEPDAPLLHEDLYTQGMGDVRSEKPSNVALHVEMGRGDVEQGFAQADVVLERTYRTQMVHQGYIEPEAETAWAQPDGGITVWADTQGIFGQRTQLAAFFQIPVSRIKVIPMEVGGAFGGKIPLRLAPLCILLSLKTGRPVQIVLTREEVLRATGPGSPMAARIKAGATREGKVTAIQAHMVYDAGAFPGAPLGGGTLAGFGAYQTANLKIDGYDVVTNKPRVQAYRAPGATAACFAVETLMDELAEAIGMDPLEFRLKNASRPGDPQPNNLPFNSIGLVEVLRRVREHPAWKIPVTGPNRGRGLAMSFWRGATGTSSCHLNLNADGSVNLMVGSVDLSATRTSFAQMVAEELGLDPSEVRVTTGDTGSVAHTDATEGSRITYTMSAAVHQSCQDVLAQLKALAAQRLDVTPEVVEYRDRNFFVQDIPGKKVSLAELATASVQGGGVVMGKGTATRMQRAPQFAAHVADVEVDPETGKVRLINYTAFQDAGLAVNSAQVEGQIQGGAAQGIGWALSEEYQFDDQGVMLNASLLDYRIPTALDVPMIDAEIVEVPASDGPYGIRGVGEGTIVAPPAAIANAIYQATGVRLRQLPMSPERVFWALREPADT